jgi:hypothetical protein
MRPRKPKRRWGKEGTMAKRKPKDEPSLLDLAKGLGKPKPKKAKRKRKPKAPLAPKPERHLVVYRRRGPKGVDPSTVNIEPGDIVTFWRRDGATVTRTVAETRAQTLVTEPYVLAIGDYSETRDHGVTVSVGRVYEVLRPNPDWKEEP